MSTLAYATLTEQREEAPADTSTGTAKPGVGTWLDVVAALVPAEVLGLHALCVKWFTETTQNDQGHNVTSITEPGVGQLVFWLLVFAAPAIYLGKKKDALVALDALRAGFVAAAFVVWTALQEATAFDAVFPKVSQNARYAAGVIVAAVIGVWAQRLAVSADKSKPAQQAPQQQPQPQQ